MRKLLPAALLASAAVAVPLAIAGSARAADPTAAPAPTPALGLVLYDAAGTPVAILRPVAAPAALPDPMLGMIRRMEAAMQADFPPPDFFARQQAMMQQAMQEMQSLAAMPGPQTVEAALGAAPGTASRVVVTSFSAGNGTCSETVSYAYPGNGGAPQVAIRRVGDACGAAGPAPMRSVPAAEPVPAPAPRQVTPAPDGTRLIHVDYAHPATPAPRLHG
jgi:hypothetical protein